MSPPEATTVVALREMVRRATEARSILGVANDIGVSHTGLKYFLNGGHPRSEMTDKLRQWVLNTAATNAKEASLRAELAFEAIVDSLPALKREKAAQAILTAIEGSYAASEQPLPKWVAKRLRER